MNYFIEKQQKSQMAGWERDKNEIILFFQNFDLEVSDLYDQIIKTGYKKMQKICYLLSKIRKIKDICDFLDKKSRECNWDVDVMKIYFLISHAEIAAKTFDEKDSKIELVKKYFEPINNKHKLNQKVRLSLGSLRGKKRNLSATEILYKIRCEYTHEGNYTGKFFRNETADEYVYNIFCFKRDSLEMLCGECNLTYKQFLTVYMEALVENIKNFITKK